MIRSSLWAVAVLTVACVFSAERLPAQSNAASRTVEEWAADLTSENSALRARATQALILLEGRSVAAMTRALDHERAAVRAAAAHVLGRIGPAAKTASARLETITNDADAAAARAARVALLRIRADAAELPRLLEALRSGEPDLQLAAAEGVAALRRDASSAGPVLAELLLADAAARAVAPEAAPTGARALDEEVGKAICTALGAIGPQDGAACARALLAVLEKPDVPYRESALQALSAFRSHAAEAVPVLLTELRGSSSWRCRCAAAEALDSLVRRDSSYAGSVDEAMKLATQDENPGVRRRAIEYMGSRGEAGKVLVPCLLEVLARDRRADRVHAANALVRLVQAGVASSAELATAFRAIAEVRDAEAVTTRHFLLGVLAELAPELRTTLPELDAFIAASEDPASAGGAAHRRSTIEGAIDSLRSKDLAYRNNAIRILAEEVRAVEAIPTLKARLFATKDPGERSAILSALMHLDAIDFVPRIRAFLDDRSLLVREAAALALAMFEDEEARPRVAEVLAELSALASSDKLLQIGMAGVADVAPALERIASNPSEDPSRRYGALSALTILGAARSAPCVARVLESIADEKELPERKRNELRSQGLQCLAELDAAAFRELFAAHRASADSDVKLAALQGLARAGDASAKAELVKLQPMYRVEVDLTAELRSRLRSARLRLSQVAGCTLRDVVARLKEKLGMPIEISSSADPAILDGRFENYVALLGFHPSALHILSCVRTMTFSGGTLEPVFEAERVRLLTPEEAGKNGR